MQWKRKWLITCVKIYVSHRFKAVYDLKCIIKRNLFRLHKSSFITALPTKQSTVLHKPLVTYTHLPRSVIGEWGLADRNEDAQKVEEVVTSEVSYSKLRWISHSVVSDTLCSPAVQHVYWLRYEHKLEKKVSRTATFETIAQLRIGVVKTQVIL